MKMIDEDNRDLSGTGSDLGLDEKDENGKDRNHQATYENESQRDYSPMVSISLKEYDKLKEQSKFITDPNMIAIVDKIGELIRALRKNIRMPL